jgi:hypothetical protein
MKQRNRENLNKWMITVLLEEKKRKNVFKMQMVSCYSHTEYKTTAKVITSI